MFRKLITRFIELLYEINHDYILLDPLELINISSNFTNIPEIYISCERVFFQYQRGIEFMLSFNYLSKNDSISVLLENKSYVYHFKINDLMNEKHKQKFYEELKEEGPNINLGYTLISLMVDELTNISNNISKLA